MSCQERAIIVMGVSGCGKSTVGRVLADRLGYVFLDADDYHPTSNVEKMRAGVPLDDEDRVPWLEGLVGLLDEHARRGLGVVLACSALKARYRRWLSSGKAVPRFVYLEGPASVIAARLEARSDHFMPTSLLESQLNTLEVPTSAIVIDIDQPVEGIVDKAREELAKPVLLSR